MNDKIQKKIDSKDWKFHELLKLKDVAKTVAEELYHELDLNDQLEMIWEKKVDDSLTFGSLFKGMVIESLEEKVKIAFQEKFESATVNFTPDEKSQPLVPVEKPASLTEKYGESKDLMTDLIKGKDVLKEPSLEEKDGKVSTRAGNVKVERV
tara:strand:+ start:122 stop:577 length:456 start_codon:yes stop_codon:yes gene_type:complete